MDPILIAALTLALIILFLGAGVWVFAGLLLVSSSALYFLLDMNPARIGGIMGSLIMRSATSADVAAIPLFVWMGELLLRTDVSRRMFEGLTPIANHLPGRLLHTNVLGSALFAAICGSSAATTATVGKITAYELDRRGYDRALNFGSLAGAGSLGLLIPPSVVLIVYGVLAEVSITRLFLAGIVPGLLMAALFSGWISLRCLMDDSLAPRAPKTGFRDLLRGLWLLLPVLVLIVLVLGSIYSGYATPSESGAVAVGATLLMTLGMGQLNFRIVRESLRSAAYTSCMIIAILITASFLSTAMAYLHVPQQVAGLIAHMDLSPYELIAVLAVFFVMLGMFLEGISITVISLPITLPLVTAAGFDPIWFGIFLVIMTELAQITPPVGFNLFILQNLSSQSMLKIAVYAVPFFLIMCLTVTILTLWPPIVLWLPALI
ncbi:TRAP transporter large permease [Pararhodobacter sp. CCB-MM2]|uniref:TRAP transporter large permease n=1 Tax=Pararhodobacter sp. CCB-MM2 TaxID=1786003 RepID=UPI0008351E2E|nr:TRAP transporter large permease subunit [Pararhodobacter sp. CCB-MM2]